MKLRDRIAAIPSPAMSDTRIAIALHTSPGYSETFIAAHLQRLKKVQVVLSNGKPPQLANERPILVPITIKAWYS